MESPGTALFNQIFSLCLRSSRRTTSPRCCSVYPQQPLGIHTTAASCGLLPMDTQARRAGRLGQSQGSALLEHLLGTANSTEGNKALDHGGSALQSQLPGTSRNGWENVQLSCARQYKTSLQNSSKRDVLCSHSKYRNVHAVLSSHRK